jgi:hypothetical protein
VATPEAVTVSLDHEDIEAIAQRVAELLERSAASTSGRRLATAKELAEALGVERSWVYGNQKRLHAIRLGRGPRARLRFDLGRAVEAFVDADESETRRAGRPRRRPATPLPPGVNLIRGRSGQ